MVGFTLGNPWHKECIHFVRPAIQKGCKYTSLGVGCKELDVKPSVNLNSSTDWLGFLGQVTESHRAFNKMLYEMGIIVSILMDHCDKSNDIGKLPGA